MLDPETGTLRLGAGAVDLTAALTRSAFLASRAGKGAVISVRNEPYCSWRLPEISVPPRRFMVVACFEDERLARVQLVDSTLELGTGWDDWNEASEKARKRSHDAWLKVELGKRRRFPWGSVQSTLDAKGGGATIVVTYGAA